MRTAEGADGTAVLAWLEDALEHARRHGQAKALAHLEAVAEDLAFEAKTAARKASAVG